MSGLLPGFADPVADAQSAFRAALEAMARPGRVQRLHRAPAPPRALCPAAGAVLLALADAETPLWLDAGAEAAEWVVFHSGCPLVKDAGAATFALATGVPPTLAALHPGTEEEPQRAATLILQVASLAEGSGWRLSGPGIEHEHRLAVDGAPDRFLAEWAVNRSRFPAGVDVILCAGDHLAALPRSITIWEG